MIHLDNIDNILGLPVQSSLLLQPYVVSEYIIWSYQLFVIDSITSNTDIYPISTVISPRHLNLPGLCHSLWYVFRSFNGILHQSFKQRHLHRLGDCMRNCDSYHVITGILKSDHIIIDTMKLHYFYRLND